MALRYGGSSHTFNHLSDNFIAITPREAWSWDEPSTIHTPTGPFPMYRQQSRFRRDGSLSSWKKLQFQRWTVHYRPSQKKWLVFTPGQNWSTYQNPHNVDSFTYDSSKPPQFFRVKPMPIFQNCFCTLFYLHPPAAQGSPLWLYYGTS